MVRLIVAPKNAKMSVEKINEKKSMRWEFRKSLRNDEGVRYTIES